MQTNKPKPWLTSTGVEIPTAELKEICKSWDADTWERYLKWYDSGCREKLIHPNLYDEIAERQTESIFQRLCPSSGGPETQLCEELLGSLPALEAEVLRLTYFNGQTERQISAEINRPKTNVHRLKVSALSRLQRGRAGEKWTTRHLMRGASSEIDPGKNSPWAALLSLPIREDRVYDPGQYKEEFAKISHAELKVAVSQLSEREQRILYLRFWCDYSVSEIAHELRSGVNLIEQVIEAAISKLKRKIIQIKTGHQPGEGPSCA